MLSLLTQLLQALARKNLGKHLPLGMATFLTKMTQGVRKPRQNNGIILGTKIQPGNGSRSGIKTTETTQALPAQAPQEAEDQEVEEG